MPLSRNNELDGKMTDKELFELPSFRYMGSDKDEQDKETAGTGVIGKKCSICTYEFEEGTKLRTLKCFHIFHKECVDEWLLKIAANCPECKVV